LKREEIEELVRIFNSLGDSIIDKNVTAVKGRILVESAYSGRDFKWTVKTLRKLERLTKMKVRVYGGMYCHLTVELQKPKTDAKPLPF
jgi:hypothetical protein